MSKVYKKQEFELTPLDYSIIAELNRSDLIPGDSYIKIQDTNVQNIYHRYLEKERELFALRDKTRILVKIHTSLEKRIAAVTEFKLKAWNYLREMNKRRKNDNSELRIIKKYKAQHLSDTEKAILIENVKLIEVEQKSRRSIYNAEAKINRLLGISEKVDKYIILDRVAGTEDIYIHKADKKYKLLEVTEDIKED